jgi:hypothetical protein
MFIDVPAFVTTPPFHCPVSGGRVRSLAEIVWPAPLSVTPSGINKGAVVSQSPGRVIVPLTGAGNGAQGGGSAAAAAIGRGTVVVARGGVVVVVAFGAVVGVVVAVVVEVDVELLDVVDVEVVDADVDEFGAAAAWTGAVFDDRAAVAGTLFMSAGSNRIGAAPKTTTMRRLMCPRFGHTPCAALLAKLYALGQEHLWDASVRIGPVQAECPLWNTRAASACIPTRAHPRSRCADAS